MPKVDFSKYDSSKYVLPPPRKLNGGLYTGEEFKKDSQYGNVPVIPDTGYLIHYNLRSANPPPGAIYQYPGNIRPGNNFQHMTGIIRNGEYNIAGNTMECVVNSCDTINDDNKDCKCAKCAKNNKMNKYYYL